MTKKEKRQKQSKLLAELENNPIVERACRKVIVHRSTFYRWIDQDPNFKIKVGEAQVKGREKLNDFVESKLLENIDANLHQAITFWLVHNNKVYSTISAAEIKRLRFYEEMVFDLLNVAVQGNDHMVIDIINKLRDKSKREIEADRSKSKL